MTESSPYLAAIQQWTQILRMCHFNRTTARSEADKSSFGR